MSDTFKRRRKRTGVSTRYGGVQLVPVESIKSSAIDSKGVLACAAVAIVVAALIALIWIVTQRAVQEQRADIRYRTEQMLTGQAATMAETISHELLLIDQSLSILQAAWKADSDSVVLTKWQQTMPALTAVTDDLFISDEKHIIRQDILPQAVGQGVGAAYVSFPHGSLESYQSDGTKDKEALLLQGQTGAPIDARQFLMYIVRPLDHPKGWLIGASYRSTELTKLFSDADLGFNPLVALVDTRAGNVQAVIGPSARRPRVDLSRTPLFGLMTRSVSGTWLGEGIIDSTDRILAFHRVADRDMVVLVGAALSEVMVPANNLTAGARALAAIGSGIVLLIGGLVLWELYTIRGHRRRQRILDRNRLELDRLRQEDANTSARAQINAARLQLVLNHVQDGIALFDSSFRLVQWNHPFLRAIGIELRADMPLETLLREQIAASLFGPISNPEGEVARRAAVLRSGDPEGLPHPGPDQDSLILRGLPVMEGGFMLLLTGLARWEPAPKEAAHKVDEPVTEVSAPAPIEW